MYTVAEVDFCRTVDCNSFFGVLCHGRLIVVAYNVLSINRRRP